MTVSPSSAASSSPKKKMLDLEGQMHHDPPTQRHISKDFSLQVKMDYFSTTQKTLTLIITFVNMAKFCTNAYTHTHKHSYMEQILRACAEYNLQYT